MSPTTVFTRILNATTGGCISKGGIRTESKLFPEGIALDQAMRKFMTEHKTGKTNMSLKLVVL